MSEININYGNKEIVAEWGAHKFKGDAQGVAEEITSIGDSATPRQIVDYAAGHKDSELYKCFEWDDTKAADHWRVHQSRVIVANLKITVIHSNKKREKTHINVFQMPERGRGAYKLTTVIIQKPDEYQALLMKAKAELESFRNKYSMLGELNGVFAAINAV